MLYGNWGRQDDSYDCEEEVGIPLIPVLLMVAFGIGLGAIIGLICILP